MREYSEELEKQQDKELVALEAQKGKALKDKEDVMAAKLGNINNDNNNKKGKTPNQRSTGPKGKAGQKGTSKVRIRESSSSSARVMATLLMFLPCLFFDSLGSRA